MSDETTPAGPQRDERGRLIGGNPGNSGGKKGRSGRPPSAVRQASREGYATRIAALKRIADGKPTRRVIPAKGEQAEEVVWVWPDIHEQIRAIDILGKYAGLQQLELSGEDGGPIPLEVTDARERIARKLARLAAGAAAAAAAPGADG